MARPNNGNGGRPKKPIDWKEAEKLCAIQCSEEEIADWFHVSIDTLARRLKEEKDSSFKEFFELHRVQGKIALRRNMFRMSEKHPSMAIFLAKNWLDMTEKTEVTGAGGEPIKTEIIVSSETAKKLTKAILNGEGT